MAQTMTTADTTTDEASSRTNRRIERLSTASVTRILEPDVDVPGAVGEGQVLPDELISLSNVPELFDTLTDEQKAVLSREEFASIAETGVRFESVLMAGFSLEILGRRDLTDPRVTYLLHEMGEETRHSRLFVRLLSQIHPQARNPLDTPLLRIIQRIVLPFIKAVSKYHRQEEARHLAFARLLFPEQWAAAGPVERFLVRHVGSHAAIGMFDTIVHPGVYATIGLPAWKTWKAVNRTVGRTAMRHRALRPLLNPLLDAG